MTRFGAAGGMAGASDAQQIDVAIEALERDGLMHAVGQTLRLGPAKVVASPLRGSHGAAVKGTAATIAE
jgi:hypothetical protein